MVASLMSDVHITLILPYLLKFINSFIFSFLIHFISYTQTFIYICIRRYIYLYVYVLPTCIYIYCRIVGDGSPFVEASYEIFHIRAPLWIIHAVPSNIFLNHHRFTSSSFTYTLYSYTLWSTRSQVFILILNQCFLYVYIYTHPSKSLLEAFFFFFFTSLSQIYIYISTFLLFHLCTYI